MPERLDKAILYNTNACGQWIWSILNKILPMSFLENVIILGDDYNLIK